ncbi:MAG TPA: hypothetical protein VH107_12340 [Lacipirellulaceae bacterium]|nr:hypothetical protein [Lacipirellulaceae bacterium]
MSERGIWAKMLIRGVRGPEIDAQRDGTHDRLPTTSKCGDGPAMSFEQIEQMKRDYTDKWVLVDATRPELARFRDVVGRVKTVNMSGRALVEFDDYHVNIGWYDIDPEFLKFMDEPPPKPAKAEAKKAAPKAAPTVKEKPTAKPAAPAAKGGRPSVADMLAAARGGGAAKPGAAAPAKPKAEGAPAAKPAAGKVDRSKMSVADMLAAARAGGATGAAPAAAPNAPAEEPAKASKPVPKAAAAPAKSGEKVDKSKMSIDDMVTWCRAHDAQ